MEEQIINFIKEDLHNGKSDFELLPDEDLLASGLVESLSMMQLIHFVEETFQIKIPPQDMTIDNFVTVEAIANYVKKSQTLT
ncbi:MAG: acyl carrier protein [Saprospiraceae bacterium]